MMCTFFMFSTECLPENITRISCLDLVWAPLKLSRTMSNLLFHFNISTFQHSTIARRRPDDEQWSPRMGMQPWRRKRYLCFYSGFGSPLTKSQMRSQLTPTSSRIAGAASIAHSFVLSHCYSLSFSCAVFSIICLFSSACFAIALLKD